MEFTYAPGATPIDPDEAAGLRAEHVRTQGELNELEALNIAAGMSWASRSRGDLLSSKFVRQLHRRMFGEVWEWAGLFRRSDKNIGVPWERIPTDLENLLRDIKYQIEHAVFASDELAMRFHHRLVLIHCFPNGNGRHARAMTDLLLTRLLKQPPFTWASSSGLDANTIRDQYIAALHAADQGDLAGLLAFVRT